MPGPERLQRQQRFVYYMISKKKVLRKPTYGKLTASLEAMRDHAVAHGVLHIAMPKIGCGLDGLKWDRVELIVRKVFAETNVKISVYEL